MYWLVTVIDEIKAGAQILVSQKDGSILPIQVAVNPPSAPQVAAVSQPAPMAQFNSYVKRSQIVRRATDKMQSDRERTLSLIAQHPAGIPITKVAELIHGRGCPPREKMFAADDCRMLADKGLIERFSVPFGNTLQACVKPR